MLGSGIQPSQTAATCVLQTAPMVLNAGPIRDWHSRTKLYVPGKEKFTLTLVVCFLMFADYTHKRRLGSQ